MRQRTRALVPLFAALFLTAQIAVAGVAGAQVPAAQVPAAQSSAAPAPGAAAPPAESRRKPAAERAAGDAGRAALAETGLTGAALDDLIETLESPTAREKFLSRLKTLRTASPVPVDAGAELRSERFGGRIMMILSDRINTVSEELVAGAALVLDAPRLMRWVRTQISDPARQQAWLQILWKIVVVLGAGLAAEWSVRRLLARPRSAVEGQDRDGVWIRLPFLIARTFLDVVPIAAFATVSYIVLPLLEPTEVTRLVAISLVNASVIARAVLAAARMFFVPKATRLRIVAIGDESANYIVLWIRRLTDVCVYGYFLSEAALLLGMPRGGYVALSKSIGLLLALLLLILVLQNRHIVAGWIRGPESRGMAAFAILRRRFADIWHVLAVIYIAAVYVVWALEIGGGFEFVFRATALSVVILFAAKILILVSRNAVDREFGLRTELMQKFPGLAVRANRYFTVLHGFITLVIALLAGLAVLEAWGVDSFAWIATPVGRRVVGSVISSLFVIAIAIVLLEMVSSVIERYLARGENGDVSISARAKTLLPLLRKALMIVVSTIVGFIVLSEIGVNIGPLLAGAGVVGLAVGFGSQTLVKDIITGIFILAEDQFAVGDVIRVSDKAGLVEDITIRTIRLRDLGGNVHIIPFSSVTTVENMTKDFSRYVFDVGVAYRENVDEVIDVLRALGEEMQADEKYGPLILEPLEILGLDSFGDSAVVIRARFTTRPVKQWEVGREFNRRMKRKFDELGIEIPFPHQTVYFGEAKGGGAPPAYVRLGGATETTAAADDAADGDEADACARPPARTDSVDRPSDDEN